MRVWQEEELQQGSNCIKVSSESESAAGNAPEAKARLRTATLLILGDSQRYLRALSGATGGLLGRGGGWEPRWGVVQKLGGNKVEEEWEVGLAGR